MIHFFRKIRKKLLDDNKPMKYLRYSIGEILLVMVGILLALQVNTWNEGRKTQSRIKLHYAELKEELKFDVERINQHILDLEEIDEVGMYVRGYLNSELDVIDTLRLKEAFLSAGFSATFDASRIAYDNLVSSGDINLITNNHLKRQLGEFHNPGGWTKSVDVGYVRQSIEEYHHYRHYFIEPLMDRFFFNNDVLAIRLPDEFNMVDRTVENSTIDWQKVRKDKEYSVKLDKVHTSRLNQKLLYYELRNSMNVMIKMIDEELDGK